MKSPCLPLFLLICALSNLSHAESTQPVGGVHTSRPQLLKVDQPPIELMDQISDYDTELSYIYHEKMQVSQLKTYQKHLKQGQKLFAQLRSMLDINNYDQMRFINNYATLLSNYAELLDQQYCYQDAQPYWEESDLVYQVGKIFQEQYPTLAYNHSLNFARQSVFYRKNQDPTKRLELLTQAEIISAALVKRYPTNNSFQQHHLNVLLDQLDIYQKQPNSYQQQKVRFEQLTPSYFKVLKQQNPVDDFGNSIIFIQKYYRFLFINNPHQAEQWLKQQHRFIEYYRSKQSSLSQREVEFLAGYYAVNRQFDLAMYYLQKINPKDDDATSVAEFKINDPLYANIRFTPEFQTWLKQYEKNSLVLKPKQCRIKNL